INPDPRVRHTVWGLVFSGAVNSLGFLFSQSSVQRIVSIRYEKHARMSFVLCMFLASTYHVIMSFTGLVLLAYFVSIRCDPLKAGYIKNRNQLMPYFVIHSLSFLPGLPGLYMASVFSASLSTLSSGINSLAANTVEDFLGGVLANKRESVVTAISKCIVCVYGAGIIGLAYLTREMAGPVTQTSYTALGATTGPLIGVFILGATFPQANAAGTLIGLLSGLTLNVWISIGSVLYGTPTPPLPPGPVDKCSTLNVSATAAAWNSSWPINSTPAQNFMSSTSMTTARSQATESDVFSLYDLSYTWTPLIGFLATVISGLLASMIN
ncbi:unnamed protein product, partial [Candidula unifasciata]